MLSKSSIQQMRAYLGARVGKGFIQSALKIRESSEEKRVKEEVEAGIRNCCKMKLCGGS